MIATMRLAWRLQRWEMAFVVIGGLGLAAMAFWQAFDMRSMLTGCGTASAASACEFVYPFQESHGSFFLLMQLIGLTPFLAGLLLGVPIVAREAAEAGEPEPDPDTLPRPAYYGIASARYSEVVFRESLALGAATAGLAGVAALLVRRRRPE